jgi:hypothetical protein
LRDVDYRAVTERLHELVLFLHELVLFLPHHALRIDVGFAENSINKAFALVLDRGLDLGRIGGVDVART